jgi:tight adherence protein B
MTVDASLGRWARHAGSAEVDLLVGAAQLGHRHGGDLAAGLDTVAASLLDRAEVADEARALSTQARTSAAALVGLPPFGAACFCLLDPAVATTLFTTLGGWCCLVGGVVLDAGGAWWMVRMVDRALR